MLSASFSFESFFRMEREMREVFKKCAHFIQCHHDAWLSILFLIAVLLFAFSALAIINFFKDLLTASLVSFSEDVVTQVKPSFGSAWLKFFSLFLLYIYCVGFHLLWPSHSNVNHFCSFSQVLWFWMSWTILKPHQSLPHHCSTPFYYTFRKTLNKFFESSESVLSG